MLAVRELTGRSQPSLGPFGYHKENYADENDKADRRIHAWQIVTFGKIVDELAQPAEIDQEFDCDHVDQCKHQSEPDADKDRQQRRGKQDFPELLRWCQLQTAPDIDQD